MAEPEPIDLNELTARTLGNPALLRELLSLFAERTGPLTGAISQAVRAGDCSAAASAAHQLRGSASTISANTLAGLVRQLEAAIGHDDAQATALLREIEAAVHRCVVQIDAIRRTA